ncbi:MAG: glycosyl hydrolase [Phycisphaerae bacterium]
MTLKNTLLTAALTLACLSTSALADINQLQHDFLSPPDNARPMVRWWWFGPAVTEQGIDRELAAMKAGGFGGVEVQPTYPLTTGDNPKILKFMSPEFLHMLGYASAKAKALGLRMDLTLGSGWPYGGPMFSPDEGAGRIESQTVEIKPGESSIPFPKLRPGYSVIAAFAGNAPEESTGRRRGPDPKADVSSLKPLQLTQDAATLPPNTTAKAVTFFIAGRTGMKVKRPADGAEGLVIDHLSSQVVDKFIHDIAEPEIKACGDNPPYAVFCDSLEVGGENWTSNFLDEFKKRRGYDLTPHLPALIGTVGDNTDAIRYDFGRTVTELYNQNFNDHFTALAHKYHSRFRIQDYGCPPAGLLSYAHTDLPEGELQSKFDFHDFRATRYAASASHLMNVPVTSAETFTWLHTAPFRAIPVDFKGEVNIHFIDGINQIICHGWPYTPDTLPYPGASFYAASVVDDKNPWFTTGMPAVTGYIQRTSAILREGAPANDIALYLPDADVWAKATTSFSSLNSAFTEQSKLLATLMDAGYNADGFDDGMLAAKNPTADNASLNFGDMHYKIVLLPAITHMPLDTARKLEAFAQSGGTVIALKIPTVVPGLNATDADQKQLATLMSHIFAPNAKSTVLQNESDLPAALHKALPPDCQTNNHEIAAVHRHTDDAELYFLANNSNEPQKCHATFRVDNNLHPEDWNPTTSHISALKSNDNSLDLTLPPYGSTIIAWTHRTLPATTQTAAPANTSIDLSSNWSVTFHPLPNGDAKTISMPSLTDWTKLDGLKNFSGTATYEKTFTLPDNLANTSLTLSLGPTKSAPPYHGGNGFAAAISPPVLDAASITLNGKNIGAVWCPPYQIDLTGNLKPGQNTLQIEVANTAVNYINKAGFPNYNLKAIRAQFGNRFDPQGTQLYAQPLPSGLLGPIQIIPTP